MKEFTVSNFNFRVRVSKVVQRGLPTSYLLRVTDIDNSERSYTRLVTES